MFVVVRGFLLVADGMQNSIYYMQVIIGMLRKITDGYSIYIVSILMPIVYDYSIGKQIDDYERLFRVMISSFINNILC